MLNVYDTKEGRMLLNDKDMYLCRSLIEYGEFSQGEVDLFAAGIRATDVVADIGANFGAHTLPLARMAAHVLAFEPQKFVYNALCGTLALNNISNVTAVNAAIGAEPGVLRCPYTDSELENNFGGISLVDIPEDIITYSVPVMPLHQPVNFMKIDVEGMEVEVLKGSAQMITACKPVLYVENDRKARSAELIALVQALGYTAYWHVVPMFNPNNFRKNPVNIFGDIHSINMLCFPEPVDECGLLRVTTDLHPNCTYTQ
jgi:FkbM family methyltransferase